jgi:hypothetical protein
MCSFSVPLLLGPDFDRACLWGEIIALAAIRSSSDGPRLAAHSYCPHVAGVCDVAPDRPHLGERERAAEHGCNFVLNAHGYSFVLRACCRARLASPRAHGDRYARGDHLCLRPLVVPADETFAT